MSLQIWSIEFTKLAGGTAARGRVVSRVVGACTVVKEENIKWAMGPGMSYGRKVRVEEEPDVLGRKWEHVKEVEKRRNP